MRKLNLLDRTSMSAVGFLTFALLVARTHVRATSRSYIVAIGDALAVLIGVRWSTDMMDACGFGIVSETAWLLAANHFEWRRTAALSEPRA